MGYRWPSELMLTGRFIDGRRAERVGLVSQCFDDAAAMEEAATDAAEMASFTPLAVEATKDAIGLGADATRSTRCWRSRTASR